jgi:uncharacterized protein YndB with AHSA1/START domain
MNTHAGSLLIKSSPEKIYAALLDPQAVKTWRPPDGMKAEIYEFKPRTGGHFRMAFIYEKLDHNTQGKSTANADVFHGTFLELVPNKKMVELVKLESHDPAYAKPMTVTTELYPIDDGTMVTITCDNVPVAISAEDHEQSINSTLRNLARWTEKLELKNNE